MSKKVKKNITQVHLPFIVLEISDFYDDAARTIVKDCEVIEFINYPGVKFIIYDKKDVLVRNRIIEKKKCILSPIQVAVYDMIIGAQLLGSMFNSDNTTYNLSMAIFRNWEWEFCQLFE
jgi:hypothetical protein